MASSLDDLSVKYSARRDALGELAANLHQVLQEDLHGVPHIDRISFRVKDASSFLGKSEAVAADGDPKYQNPLREIEDQVAGRVIVFFLADIERVGSILEKSFRQVEYESKEPADDSAFGYQSYHHVFLIPEHHKPWGWESHQDMPATFELQIRTLFMHAWAEPQHDMGYKGKELPREAQRMLAWIAASAWGADRALDQVAREIMRMNAGVNSGLM